MQKIKVFYMILIVFVLTAAPIEGVAGAADVTGMNKSKGRIHIDGGIDAGVHTRGYRVFFSIFSCLWQ